MDNNNQSQMGQFRELTQDELNRVSDILNSRDVQQYLINLYWETLEASRTAMLLTGDSGISSRARIVGMLDMLSTLQTNEVQDNG